MKRINRVTSFYYVIPMVLISSIKSHRKKYVCTVFLHALVHLTCLTLLATKMMGHCSWYLFSDNDLEFSK